jgi:hypothetical protein
MAGTQRAKPPFRNGLDEPTDTIDVKILEDCTATA